MSKNGMKPSTLAQVRHLLGEVVTVEASGLRIALHPPTAAVGFDLRQKVFELAEKDAQGSLLLEVARLAVKACLAPPLDKLTREEVAQLVMRSGGEASPLGRTALDMCGVGYLLNQPATTDEDPTGFLSPAPPRVV